MSRKQISLSDAIDERAKAIIKARGFSGLSGLLDALIREEYERRYPPIISEPGAYVLNDKTSLSKKTLSDAVEALETAEHAALKLPRDVGVSTTGKVSRPKRPARPHRTSQSPPSNAT